MSVTVHTDADAASLQAELIELAAWMRRNGRVPRHRAKAIEKSIRQAEIRVALQAFGAVTPPKARL